MFLSPSSYQTAPSVRTYADAEAALLRVMFTPTGKPRKEKEYGFPLTGPGAKTKVAWVRKDSDGDIAFRLYNTDVVVWHADGRFSVENYGTSTTSVFASQFLPVGIHLTFEKTVLGEQRGNNTLIYHHGGERHVCCGDVVTFIPQPDGSFLPDEATCSIMTMPVKAAPRVSRDVSTTYRLAAFRNWLSMAPLHLDDMQHAGFDITTCADALLDGNFRRAAEHMPSVKASNAFGRTSRDSALRIAVKAREHIITLACVDHLRLALLDYEGALPTREFTTMPQAEFDKSMALVRRMQALGLSTYKLGPR